MPKNVPNQAIVYESLKREIEGDLKDLQQAGVDISELQKEYQRIINSMEEQSSNECKPITGIAMAFDPMGIYIKGQALLKDFQKKLKKYDDYYNCSYSCETLEEQLRKEDLNLTEALPKMVEEISKSLDVIFHSSTEASESEEEIVGIVEKVVDIAYRIMKLEFVMYGESTIFEKIEPMHEHIGLFESFIRKDLETVDLSQKKYSKIRNRINRIQQNGVKSHLVDDRLIQLIAVEIDKKCAKALKKNFEGWGTSISTQQCDFKIEQEKLNQLDQQYESRKKKRVVPKLIGRGLLLAGTVIIGSTLLMNNIEPAILKNIEASQLEKHTVTYYPTIYEEMLDGEVVASFTKDEIEPELDKSQIIVYTPYQEDGNKYTRNITTYELPTTSASMSLEELATLDLAEVEGQKIPETKEFLFPSELYEQDMIRIIRIFDEKKSYDVVDQESFEKDLEEAQSRATMLLEGTLAAVIGAEAIFLLRGFKTAIEEAKRKKEYSRKVTEILENILVIFQENKELRRKFDRLYPFYERIIPDDAAIVQTKIKSVGEDMQEAITKLEYRLKKRPQ